MPELTYTTTKTTRREGYIEVDYGRLLEVAKEMVAEAGVGLPAGEWELVSGVPLEGLPPRASLRLREETVE